MKKTILYFLFMVVSSKAVLSSNHSESVVVENIAFIKIGTYSKHQYLAHE